MLANARAASAAAVRIPISVMERPATKVADVPWVNSGAAERKPNELCELLLLKLRADHDDASLLEIIGKPGVNLECRDERGNTPLIIAADKSRKEIVRALLANGANVNAANTEGNTSLYRAGSNYLNEVTRRDVHHSVHKVAECEEILDMIIEDHAFNKYSDAKLQLTLGHLRGTRFAERISNRKVYIDGGKRRTQKRRSKKSRRIQSRRKLRSKTVKTFHTK